MRLWFIRIFWALAVLVLVLVFSWLLLVGYRYLTTHPYFRLKVVEVQGNQRYTKQGVIGLAGIDKGVNSLDLDLTKVRDRLLKDPWIKSARVRRILPNEVQIQVEERQASYWVLKGDGLYLADQNGQPIAPLQVDGFVSLPQLDLPDEADARSALGLLSRRLQDGGLPFSAAELDWIRFRSGFLIEAKLRDSPLRIVLEQQGLSRHLERLVAVWRDLEDREELGRVEEIVCFQDKAWVSFE